MPDREGIANSQSQMDYFCRENGFASRFETSAKENSGIDTAAQSLISEVSISSFFLL